MKEEEKNITFLEGLIDRNEKLLSELKELKEHLIQTIIRFDSRVPVDRMEQFTQILQKPLKIDDERIFNYLKKFQEDLKKLSELDMAQTVCEVKFLSKKVIEMEEKLNELHKQGLEHSIDLNFRVDGYRLVKQPLHYDPSEQIARPYAEYQLILNLIPEELRDIVVQYLGMLGCEKKTFKLIATEKGVIPQTISQRFHQAIRILRESKNVRFVKKMPECPLKDIVLKPDYRGMYRWG